MASSRANNRYWWRPGYVLRRQHDGGRLHLPADLYRHFYAVVASSLGSGDRKTPITAADLVNDRNCSQFLRCEGGEALPRADDRPHGILRQPRAPRI